jgi:hypothetical protein
MFIVEPPSQDYEPEHRYQFVAQSPSGPHVVVQGSVDTFLHAVGYIQGNPNEGEDNEYDVRLEVGPFWRDVQAVVPKVTIDGFRNTNSDEDDQQKWEIKDLTWDTIGELGASNDELRIRLKMKVLVRGEVSQIIRLGYYLLARGRRLGAGGLNTPGPVRSQG